MASSNMSQLLVFADDNGQAMNWGDRAGDLARRLGECPVESERPPW